MSGDTRERILAVANELFIEQGYEGTSLREIADRLDITKAALYYHFRSKDEILETLLEPFDTLLDELLGRLEDAHDVEGWADALTWVVAQIFDYLDFFRLVDRNRHTVELHDGGRAAQPRGDALTRRGGRACRGVVGGGRGAHGRGARRGHRLRRLGAHPAQGSRSGDAPAASSARPCATCSASSAHARECASPSQSEARLLGVDGTVSAPIALEQHDFVEGPRLALAARVECSDHLTQITRLASRARA